MNLKRHTLNLSFFVLLVMTALQAMSQQKSTVIQEQEGRKFYLHKIEKGQSLYAISKLYGVSVDELYNLNPELKNGAKAGQEIRIAVQSPSVQSSSTSSTSQDTGRFITHKINKGETIYSICRRYNLSERQLAAYNPMLSQGLKEGQVIVVGEKVKSKPAAKSQAKSPVAAKQQVLDSAQWLYPSKVRKEKYTIALALPFRIDQTRELDLQALLRSRSPFPNIPSLSIDFYLGFKLAMDSLNDEQFKTELRLYDIDDKDSLKLAAFAKDPAFKELDLIIGPLYAGGFKSISKKAKDQTIPIVSPITQQNKILFNNPFISKTNPSVYTLLESLADYCIDSLMKEKCNIILVAASDKEKKDANFVNAFRKYFTERQKQSVSPVKDSLRVVSKGVDGIKAAYLPGVKNIVINLSSNQVLISDFITQLALFSKDKDIVLCGWEGNSSNDNIDQEYLNDLHYTFPYPFNLIDTLYSSSRTKYYMEKMGTCPSEYFHLGFDLGYYYLKHLKDNGPDFIHHLDRYPAHSEHLRFKFSRPDISTGFDNRGVFIYRYNNYKLSRTAWE